MISKHALTIERQEQLQLFPSDEPVKVGVTAAAHLENEASKRERLAALLQGELNFHNEDSGYASHDLHAFAAKFPPQLPRTFIRGLSKPGDLVLDPMMGSGTTVVEALLADRQGFGLDIDPLALHLVQVKTTPLDSDILREAGNQVITQAASFLQNTTMIEDQIARQFDKESKAFIDYWFFPSTQRELMALTLAIGNVQDARARRFMELTFSATIITKSGGVSRARDLAHSRPHRVETKAPKSALDQFAYRLRKNIASISQIGTNNRPAFPVAGDARSMPFASESIDLIVTSPPYANAIDYMRAHKFSLVWLGKPVKGLSELRAQYIGSERVGNGMSAVLPDRPEGIVRQLASLDPKKAKILGKYFAEMGMALSEMYRVLCPDSPAIIVVGSSMMREIDVQTHSCLADLAAERGFEVVGVAKRALDRNKRMMPARFGKKTDSMIEQRMHEEYVLGLLKPGCSARILRGRLSPV